MERFDAQASRLARAAQGVARLLGAGAWILDLVLLPNDAIGLVEVNPGLTPQEVAALEV